MKNLIVLLSILFIFSSCKEERKIQIIPDYDSEYILAKNLDVEPELIDNNKEVLKHIYNIIRDNFTDNNKEVYYFFTAKIYINKNGKIDKIQFLKRDEDNKYKNAIVNPNLDNLYSKLTEYFENLNFTPGAKYGNEVPSRIEWKTSFKVDKDKNVDLLFKSIFDNKNIFKSIPINKEEYLISVEEMPSPIGGIISIQKKIKYPELAKKAGIEGRVFVRAYIDEKGNVTYAEILRGIGGGCDEVALKAVKETKFIPGKHQGNPQKVQVLVPLLFKLSNTSENKRDNHLSEIKKNIPDFRLKGYDKIDLSGKAQLKGKVIDANTGIPIGGCNIIIKGTNKGAATDENGNFFSTNIPPGSYPIIVTHPNYGKFTVQWVNTEGKRVNIELKPNNITNIDIKLTKSNINK